MRTVAVHRDAVVITSLMWQTNAVALRAGDEAMLVDSPYYPEELDALAGVLAAAGFEPDALIATHADFDHVLGRAAFPGLALGMAESSVERLRREPGAAQRELREKDAELYVERPRPLALGELQSLPAPGSVELGDVELELQPAEGHTPDGMSIFARHCGVLCLGDYLSRVEIPWISEGGSLPDYQATLERLGPLVEAAETVVPGHGAAHDRETALRLLEEDSQYLDALARGQEKIRLPKGRDTKEQQRIHAENLSRV
jgi:glyoxylase-like metal-dependent hydrolase (beta-lactamase superfamily II)